MNLHCEKCFQNMLIVLKYLHENKVGEKDPPHDVIQLLNDIEMGVEVYTAVKNVMLEYLKSVKIPETLECIECDNCKDEDMEFEEESETEEESDGDLITWCP